MRFRREETLALVALAEAVAVQQQGVKEFESLLNRALAIHPDATDRDSRTGHAARRAGSYPEAELFCLITSEVCQNEQTHATEFLSTRWPWERAVYWPHAARLWRDSAVRCGWARSRERLLYNQAPSVMGEKLGQARAGERC